MPAKCRDDMAVREPQSALIHIGVTRPANRSSAALAQVVDAGSHTNCRLGTCRAGRLDTIDRSRFQPAR
jgi:hypothetical protein